MKNEGSSLSLKTFVVSIDEIELLTGIDFFPKLDNTLEKHLESKKCFTVIQVRIIDVVPRSKSWKPKKSGNKKLFSIKALKVLKTTFTWLVILTVVLMVEIGFPGTSWLSETIIMPFIIFQLVSALKNASNAGFIKHSVLNTILEKIDKHKDK